MTDIPTITVQQLEEALASSYAPLLLDVREPSEIAQSAIPGILPIPLAELPGRLEQLDSTDAEQLIAVICRSGGRSARATAFLLSNGFNAANVQGGMLAYVAEVDPTLPTP